MTPHPLRAPALLLAALLASPAAAALLDAPEAPWLALARGTPLTASGALGATLQLRGQALPAAAMAQPAPDLDAALALAYAALGLPPPAADARAASAAQAAALPRELEARAAALVAALVAPGEPLARAAGIAAASDALVLALPPVAPAGELFRDPYGLVRIGGSGPDVYHGNDLASQVPEAPVAPYANLLTIDLGGDDRYTNNAGGASPAVGVCPHAACGVGLPAAAAIDAGGDDAYEYRVETFSGSVLVTVQGAGAYGGVGVLLDLGGADAYLIDAYTHAGFGDLVFGQGGSNFGGVGILVDAAGNDRYTGLSTRDSLGSESDLIVQGASGQWGASALLDGGGDDAYVARQSAATLGWYIQIAQGGAFAISSGLLLDLGGDDLYHAAHATPSASCDQHVQGVAEAQAGGALLDLGGDDRYVAEQSCVGGGRIAQGDGLAALGVLLDASGTDWYSQAYAGDGKHWVNGTLGLGLDLQLLP